MTRRFAAAFLILLVAATALVADEVKGVLKSVDGDKGSLVVAKDKEDHSFRISMATKILDMEGREVIDGLKDKEFKKGAQVQVTFEKKGKTTAVKEVKLLKKADDK